MISILAMYEADRVVNSELASRHFAISASKTGLSGVHDPLGSDSEQGDAQIAADKARAKALRLTFCSPPSSPIVSRTCEIISSTDCCVQMVLHDFASWREHILSIFFAHLRDDRANVRAGYFSRHN